MLNNSEIHKTCVYLIFFISIDKPNENGQICSIPFQLNEVNNYFCAINQNEPEYVECQIKDDDNFKECNLGIIKVDFIFYKDDKIVF